MIGKLILGDSLWGDVVFVIIAKTPKIATNCRQVIWLRGVRYRIIVIEKNALRCEFSKLSLDKR
jgi:hypothetical protein